MNSQIKPFHPVELQKRLIVKTASPGAIFSQSTLDKEFSYFQNPN
jgi:hypothetical protein